MSSPGPTPAEHCGKGHSDLRRDSTGRRYCAVCKHETNQRTEHRRKTKAGVAFMASLLDPARDMYRVNEEDLRLDRKQYGLPPFSAAEMAVELARDRYAEAVEAHRQRLLRHAASTDPELAAWAKAELILHESR